MKNAKRLLIMFGLVMVMMLLCSCQKLETMTIDTQMNITKDFDGERVMDLVMPKTVLDYLFSGNLEQLRAVIEKYCPSDMGCTITLEGDKVNIRLCVPFASYGEYKTKIFTIINDEHNPNRTTADATVYYDSADTLFKEGFTLKESFTTWDLLAWIPAAIKTEFPEYDNEDIDGLFLLGTTVLTVDGQAYPVNSKIQYSNMESCAFDTIKVYLNVDQIKGTYECQVELIIDRDNYEQLKNYKIDDKLKGCTNSKMDLNSSLSNAYKTYYISFTTKTATVCKNYLDKIFDSNDSVIQVQDQNKQGGELKAQKSIDFYVNTGNYIDFSVPDSEAVYIISINGIYNLESCKASNNLIKKYTFDAVGSEMSVAEVHLSGSDQVSLLLGTDISVDQIDVTTKVVNLNKLHRNISFYLSEANEVLIGDNLSTRIKERLGEGISFERIDIGDGSVNYSVDITASSVEELSDRTCAFLDGDSASHASVITGGKSERNTLRKIRMSYKDLLDFNGFLGSSAVTQGIHYKFEYPKAYKAAFADAAEYENVEASYSVISCTTFNKILSIESTGEQTNYVGITMMVLWYVSVALILFVLLMNLPGIIRCLKLRHINWNEFGLFRRRGYVFATLLIIGVVIFVVTSVRLIFKVY